MFSDIEFCAFRLQLPQKMNGKGKNLGLEEEKQFTCLYTIGGFSLFLSVSVFTFLHLLFLLFFPSDFFSLLNSFPFLGACILIFILKLQS